MLHEGEKKWQPDSIGVEFRNSPEDTRKHKIELCGLHGFHDYSSGLVETFVIRNRFPSDYFPTANGAPLTPKKWMVVVDVPVALSRMN